MIHYISPYRRDKNIGKAINDAVKALRYEPGDWIVHTDHDVLFLLPDTKAHIEEILEQTHYDVLGCLTNRIGVPEQCVTWIDEKLSDIVQHVYTAHKCWQLGHDIVTTTRGPLAAFMLCFRATVWETVGGFTEGTLNFDSVFSEQARFAGYKTGIMQGIYVFHLYRFLSNNPRREISHLINSK